MSQPRDLDATELALLQTLKAMVGGMDPTNPYRGLTADERIAAGERYSELLRRKESAEAWHLNHTLGEDKQKHDQQMTEERLKLEVAKLDIDAHNETRRIDLEFERLEVQKAEVIIRAIEVAARNPEMTQLLGVVKEMSYRLLGGEALPAMQIEDKSKDNQKGQ